MVIPVIPAGATRAPHRSRSMSLHFVSFALCASLLSAQVPTPGATPANPAPAAAPQSPAPAETPKLGRIVVEKAQLRCWPGNAAQPPCFEDVLPKDQVVAVGRTENGFRAVLLPLGPVGYVSRKFTDVGDDGTVKTKGTKVAFRYRARSSEAPVTTLAANTVLHVVGEQPDWFRVRVPAIEAWLPEAEVQIGDPADAALATGFAALEVQQKIEVQARLDAIAAAKKQDEQNKADLAAVQAVQEAFSAEMGKPVAQQNYAGIEESLAQVVAKLAPESAGKAVAEALQKRIETQRFVAEATVLRDEKPAPVPVAPTEPRDQLADLSIGWLRYERRLGSPGIYFLEKGGRRLYLVSCNTGRYDLALFVDREVGITGPRRRPAAESLAVLDAERLLVLGTTAP